MSWLKIFIFTTLFTLLFLPALPAGGLFTSPTYAIYDPLSVPNNKIGIHLIQPSVDEFKPAQELVNTNGDWGYITLLIESKDRNEGKWQEVFNQLRRRHLIPLIRLATIPNGGVWKRPYENEEQAWADFLDKLNWPTKNRYIIIYNEPNHGSEWGGTVDPKGYAQVLDKTINALKKKSPDFFILNAGLDASAPSKLPLYEDQVGFMQKMNQAVPGIFEKLDGWVSHSYPNPGFLGSPDGIGRGTVRTWAWEQELLKQLGLTRQLPIFITETGWKQSEGVHHNDLHTDSSLLPVKTVASYYKQAFNNAWNHPQIVAVTPFVLGYQDPPFDHFSFKGKDSFHPQYQVVKDLTKVSGKPIQENKAKLLKGEVYSSMVKGESYQITLTFKNIGQSIWNGSTSLTTSDQVKLVPYEGGKELGLRSIELPPEVKIEPGQEYTFKLELKAPESGTYIVRLNLFNGANQFDSEDIRFATEVKSPVILKIKSSLRWKKDHSGNYLLNIAGAIGNKITQILLDPAGNSQEVEARYLLPDYSFNFTLERPFYKPKTIRQTVKSGVNELDFGTLQPDIPSAILRPRELWKLLPFSN